jgi:hypothetical protein
LREIVRPGIKHVGVRLSPRQVDAVASAICGDNATPFAYRTGTQLTRFVAFTGVDVAWLEGSSRFYDMQAFADACNATPPGPSGLPTALERVFEALLDLREFPDWETQERAITDLSRALGSLRVEFIVSRGGQVEVRGRGHTPGQTIIEEEITTVFGEALQDSRLTAAREHYRKAKGLLSAREPDHANAAKEAVCAIESLLKALTGETDFNRAIEKAIRAGDVPRPLGEMFKKFYAYRGDEPGVAHASSDVPDVDHADAQFAVNVAATMGVYLRSKLIES